MSTNALSQFDELKASIAELVAPTLKIKITSLETNQAAIETGQQVKYYLNEVEKKRKALVAPLNDQVRTINDYAKSITAPLLQSEQHIKAQVVAFDQEREKKRQAELARLEAERIRKEAELRAKQEAELQSVAETTQEDEWFGLGDEPEQVQKVIEEKHAVEAHALSNEADAKAWAVKQEAVKNIRKNWKCDVTDMDQVPVQYLKRELNTQMVLAAVREAEKQGKKLEIPGVRLWQEASLALGANTRIPALAERKS